MVKDIETLSDLSYEDILDSRDLEYLLAELECLRESEGEPVELCEDHRDLLSALGELKAETEDEGWEHGIAFIRDSYFVTYAEDYADSIGAIDSSASWPLSHIDWNAAARELQMDYSCTTIGGVTYWYQEA
jgi:hypothetical protein